MICASITHPFQGKARCSWFSIWNGGASLAIRVLVLPLFARLARSCVIWYHDRGRVWWAVASSRLRLGEVKSGLRRAGCWLTARRGDPTASATENIPPRSCMQGGVRVK